MQHFKAAMLLFSYFLPCLTVVEEGFIQKKRQRSLLLFGEKNPWRASYFTLDNLNYRMT